MSEQEYLALLLPYTCSDLASKIAQEQKVSETQAVSMLYNSMLYEYLENEASKVWKYSTEALYDLFLQEQMTGQIVFPDV